MPAKAASSGDAIIDVGDGNLSVAIFHTDDPDVVGYFQDVPAKARAERLQVALKLGVVALRTIGTTERVDYVEKRFNELRGRFEKELEKTFGPNGEVSRIIEDHFGEDGTVPKSIEDAFGEDGQLQGLLDETFGEDGRLVKELFDPSRPGTPLFKLRLEVERQFADLRKELGLAEKEQEMAAKTTLKGAQFEDVCESLLANIAKPLGDLVQRTTDKPGSVKGSKKGDFVISISDRPDIRLVVEAKDLAGMSINSIENEMKEALENRGAAYGIFVARSVSALPKTVGWFNEYWGNTLVLALGEDAEAPLQAELLRVGYKWARTKALAARATAVEGLDATLIQARVEEARRSMKKFAQIRTHCTNAKQAVDEIVRDLQASQDGLEASLDAINDEIRRGGK